MSSSCGADEVFVGGDEVEAFDLGIENDAFDGFAEDERLVEGAAGGIFGEAESAGGVALGIAVDDEGALFGCGERGA